MKAKRHAHPNCRTREAIPEKIRRSPPQDPARSSVERSFRERVVSRLGTIRHLAEEARAGLVLVHAQDRGPIDVGIAIEDAADVVHELAVPDRVEVRLQRTYGNVGLDDEDLLGALTGDFHGDPGGFHAGIARKHRFLRSLSRPLSGGLRSLNL